MGRPEVQQHQLTVQIMERDRVVRIADCEIRRGITHQPDAGVALATRSESENQRDGNAAGKTPHKRIINPA